jgi:hypothetical protein
MATAAEQNGARLYDLAYRRARKDFGDGWLHIGQTFRRGAIAHAVLHIIASQAETVPAETVRALANDLHARLGQEPQ